MPVRFEMFQAGSVSSDVLWGLVGDLRRLPEWTDVERVADIRPEPVGVGSQVETVEAGSMRLWRITTWEPRLYEMRTTTERGEVRFGCRVVRDNRGGSRIILAAGLHAAGLAGGLRARLLDGPALRRRMDDWARHAVRVAAASAG
ncbi:MAG: hypothetical protein GEU74_07440 [Nitriliruptorales bacterium]|nr:hypothetical protein [Nitriliruptorales bacterium]